MFRWLLLASIFTFCSAFTNAELANLNPLSGHGFIKGENSQSGFMEIQVEMDLQDGFSAYGDKFKLKITKPTGIEVGEVFIEPLIEFEDKISKKKKTGVRGKATLNAQLQLNELFEGPATKVYADLTYIACTDKICLTPRVLQLEIETNIGGSEEVIEDKASSGFIQKQIEGNLAYAILLIFIFGFLTSLTPCVYPLIPITLAVLGTDKDRSHWQSFLMSLSYVIGIGITYAILGVIAAQTGQLFGSLIRHPAVIITMSLIFILMGLSLLGLFEIQPPASVRNRLGSVNVKKSPIGAFVSGLLAGIIASPCVGPVLVGVLAYIAQSQDSVLGFVLLFTFAMGFGVLFLILGTFGQLANKIPRSGMWMNRVKALLALCLFILAGYYAWPLAKPYIASSNISSEKSEGVSWQKFDPQKVIEAKAANRPVIIDFYADWCVACVEMDQFTFSDESVINKSRQFVMLKVDATSPFPELKDWQVKYKVYGLPTMIFIGPNGEVREDLTLTGFEEAPEFIQRMNDSLKN